MVALVIFSAFFSATETAFSTLNRVRIKTMAENGDFRAQRVLSLSDRYDNLLSTILVGNNIVNIGLASIATVFFVNLIGSEGATVSTAVITVVVLIFGEISPKSLAKESPERFAMFAAPVLRVLMILLTPVNFLFAQWKKFLSRVFVHRDDRKVTEDELLTIVQEAENEGGINEQESGLIRNAITFNDREARDVLVPRVDLEAVDQKDSKEKIAQMFAKTNYSRLPVYEESIDHIKGILLEKDFHNRAYQTDVPVTAILKPAVFVGESIKIRSLLQLLQQNKSHMAVVADEYGGTVGIVTMEDILEELVGEIWDEHDEVIQEIQKISDDCYHVLCTVGLDRLLEFFDVHQEPDAATVNGWVMEQLGKIPETGDKFAFDRLLVAVTRVDDRRAQELEITLLPEEETDD